MICASRSAEAERGRTDGPPLNAALRAMARLHLIFGLLLAIGLSN